MPQAKCSICSHPELEAIEKAGQAVLAGTASWRSIEREFSVRGEAAKNHMEKHVLAPAVVAAEAQLDEELEALIQEAREGLIQQFHMAPDDVKPLVLVAIRNLDGVRESKPSMETLIKSLKTITEMTGMKSQQKLMVDFARAMFKAPAPAPLKVANEAPALPAGGGE